MTLELAYRKGPQSHGHYVRPGHHRWPEIRPQSHVIFTSSWGAMGGPVGSLGKPLGTLGDPLGTLGRLLRGLLHGFVSFSLFPRVLMLLSSNVWPGRSWQMNNQVDGGNQRPGQTAWNKFGHWAVK